MSLEFPPAPMDAPKQQPSFTLTGVDGRVWHVKPIELPYPLPSFQTNYHLRADKQLNLTDESVVSQLQTRLEGTKNFLTTPVEIDDKTLVGEEDTDQPEGKHFTEGFSLDKEPQHRLVQLVANGQEGLMQCFIPDRIAIRAISVSPAIEAGPDIWQVVTPEATYLIRPQAVGEFSLSGLEEEVTIQPDGTSFRDERTVIVEQREKGDQILSELEALFPEENRLAIGIDGLPATFIRFDDQITQQSFSEKLGQALAKPLLAGHDQREGHGVNADSNPNFDARFVQLITGAVVLTPDFNVVCADRSDKVFGETQGNIAITVMGHASFPDEDQKRAMKNGEQRTFLPNIKNEADRESHEELAIFDTVAQREVPLSEFEPIGVMVIHAGQEGYDKVTQLSQRHAAILWVYKLPGQTIGEENLQTAGAIYKVQKRNEENKRIIVVSPQDLENIDKQGLKPASWNYITLNLIAELKK